MLRPRKKNFLDMKYATIRYSFREVLGNETDHRQNTEIVTLSEGRG